MTILILINKKGRHILISSKNEIILVDFRIHINLEHTKKNKIKLSTPY